MCNCIFQQGQSLLIQPCYIVQSGHMFLVNYEYKEGPQRGGQLLTSKLSPILKYFWDNAAQMCLFSVDALSLFLFVLLLNINLRKFGAKSKYYTVFKVIKILCTCHYKLYILKETNFHHVRTILDRSIHCKITIESTASTHYCHRIVAISWNHRSEAHSDI